MDCSADMIMNKDYFRDLTLQTRQNVNDSPQGICKL